MKRKQLVVTSSPHIKDETTVSQIMWAVVISLIPAILMAAYFFKGRAIAIIIVSVLGAVITEFLCQKIRDKTITIKDGSAVITGILLALTLPPTVPLWLVLVGSVVAIILGKQLFGGLGYNPFNPALVGRAFLLAAYPVLMTTWMIDGKTQATPLNLRTQGIGVDYWDLFIGNIPGSLGETSAFALLLGASYLIYKGVIPWRIPAGILGSVFVLTFIFDKDPLFHLFAGGLILGAFYMATDLVTTPITKLGRIIFGIGTGVIIVIIRLWGGYPEGVLYAILLMNTTVPLLNRFTRPRGLGEVK